MDQAIKESIDNFEYKKEFREVKLKTRQSFREDQAALERRLSKRTDGRTSGKGMSNAEANGDAERKENDVLSKLESIVLDIGHEKVKEKDRKMSTDDPVKVGEENGFRKVSVDSDHLDVEKEKGDTDVVRVNMGVINGKSEPVKVSHKNGYIVNQEHQNVNGSNLPNGQVQNGHSVVPNGPGTLLNRPKINVPPRAAMTPEPRLKSLKGLYQKNPKLSSTSTDHLDNVSLKGFKLTGVTQGQKTEYQQVSVPAVPGAEVASIPADGNLNAFSVEQMVTVFRLLRLPEELVFRLCKCKVDGKRFAVFSDSELTDLGMNNPIIRYFRDKTAQKSRKTSRKFML